MIVFSLDGIQSKWNVGKYVNPDLARGRSSFHMKARELIFKLYPNFTYAEEIPIQTKRGTTLYLDFYIPHLKAAVEVHGQQHYGFSNLFHGTLMDFVKQKKKDVEKREWCERNGIRYVELPYNEDIDEWTTRITGEGKDE